MPAEVETMMYYGQVPWHGLGTRVEDVLTWREAIVAAGLDWTVRLEPVYRRRGETFAESRLAHFTVREQDGTVLGVVGPGYQVVQNAEAFQFLDDVVDDSRPKYETAGSLRGGRKVWALARLPREIRIGGIDEVIPYLLLVNAHDGSHSLMVAVTPVRVVCMNTLNAALRGTRRMWKTAHYGDIRGRVQAARETLGLAFEYLDAFEEVAERLCGVTLTDAELRAFARAVFPDPKDKPEATRTTENRREELVRIAQAAPDLTPFRGTAWAALNAATAMNDHRLRTKHQDRNLERTWFDTGVKDRALAALVARLT